MTPFAPDSPLVGDLAASPNQGERRGVAAPDSIILHYTGMPTGDSALAWLRDPRSQVSCHYFVREDGRIVQLVPEAGRAWHAGVAFWAGATDLNSRSIGIEIVNPGHEGGLPDFRRPRSKPSSASART
jgi:N-acetylmuramoyl-L-alanine amidase